MWPAIPPSVALQSEAASAFCFFGYELRMAVRMLLMFGAWWWFLAVIRLLPDLQYLPLVCANFVRLVDFVGGAPSVVLWPLPFPRDAGVSVPGLDIWLIFIAAWSVVVVSGPFRLPVIFLVIYA